MSDLALTNKIRLLEIEVGNLGEDLQEARREQRAEIDRLRLELEVVRTYLQENEAGFARQLPALLDRVRLETVPE